jgi:hypothetical protein
MPDRAQFEALRLELLRGGTANLYVERTLRELADHYEDLERASLAAGCTSEEAAQRAGSQLGSAQLIAAAVFARPELRSWSWSRRWPMVALCARSAAALGVLPALPVMYVAGRSDGIARWGGAIGAALVLVGSLYSALDWIIMAG